MTESNELRITLPDLGNAFQIHATGMALINCFSADLYDFINKSLIKTDGPEWLQTLEITAANVGKTNFKDPALLLKRLTENQNGEIRTILRKPLNSVIPSNYHKEFYNLLDQLLADRHTWFHQEIDVSSDVGIKNIKQAIFQKLGVAKPAKSFEFVISRESVRP